jgi:hypothetical protein
MTLCDKASAKTTYPDIDVHGGSSVEFPDFHEASPEASFAMRRVA